MARQRKTRDEWAIEGRYAHGWEEVTAADTWPEARGYLRDYRTNEPGTEFRARSHRVKIQEAT